MTALLYIFSFLAFAIGLWALTLGRGILDSITLSIIFLIGAVFFSGAGIVFAVNRLLNQVTPDYRIRRMSPKMRNELIGKKIKLLYIADNYARVKRGHRGVIESVDGSGTVFVNWDNGAYLGLVPGVDDFRILEGD